MYPTTTNDFHHVLLKLKYLGQSILDTILLDLLIPLIFTVMNIT